MYLRIPPSQNYTRIEPIAFSPLPPTQLEEDQDIELPRPKVRQLIDDDDKDDSNIRLSDESNNVNENDDDDDDDDEGEEDMEDNEELADYRRQLFEMEAEESGQKL